MGSWIAGSELQPSSSGDAVRRMSPAEPLLEAQAIATSHETILRSPSPSGPHPSSDLAKASAKVALNAAAAGASRPR